jgi:hypothetical protein
MPASNRSRLALLGLLVLYLVLAVSSLLGKSATVDEYAHLPAGCAALRHGTLDLYGKNPPLVRYLLAAPPLVLGARVPLPDLPTRGAGWDPWTYADVFVEANAGAGGLGRYADLLLAGRLAVVALGALLVWLVHAWGCRLHGPAGGAAAAFLLALSPTFLAHARLATVDVGATLAITVALYLTWRALEAPGPARWGAAGAALGLAVASKFTALLLLPVLALGWVAATWWPPRPERPVRRWRPDRRSVWSAVAFLLAAWLAVHAAYRLREPLGRLDGFHFFSRLGKGVAAALPGWTPVPLPGPLVRGMDAQLLDLQDAEMPNYLNGRWSRRGWWYYYPEALLLKTPLALWGWILLAAAAAWTGRRGPRGPAGEERPRKLAWVLAGGWVGALLATSLASHLDIGIRYLLPILPCLFLLLGGAAGHVMQRGRGWQAVLVVLALAYAGAVVRVHPHYLPFFNSLAGGPAGGWRYLANSNNDWGQDLPLLARWLEEHPEAERGPIHLAYFGHLDPARYGIDYVLPPDQPRPGIHVVSLNFLLGMPYLVLDDGRWTMLGEDLVRPQNEFAWLRNRQPVARLGHSLWVFQVEGSGGGPEITLRAPPAAPGARPR